MMKIERNYYINTIREKVNSKFNGLCSGIYMKKEDIIKLYFNEHSLDRSPNYIYYRNDKQILYFSPRYLYSSREKEDAGVSSLGESNEEEGEGEEE